MKKITVIILLLSINFLIDAQPAGQTEENFLVSVQYSSENPIIGRPWIFTIIVDYPNPDEVTLVSPMFGFLALERIAKSPRLIEGRLQTAADYRFIPNRTGRFTLESFAIICPSGVASTEPVFLNIHAENEDAEPVVLQLVWNNAPARLEAGEQAVLFLQSNLKPSAEDINSGRPPYGFFVPEVPAGLILQHLQLTEEDEETGAFAKFVLIPLEGNVNLPSRVLRHENTIYQIPPLRITVTNRPETDFIQAESKNFQNTTREEFFLSSNMAEKNQKQRIMRLGYFYSVFFLVIIIMFICLYLLLKKK